MMKPPRAPKQHCTRNRCFIDNLPWHNILPKCCLLRRNFSSRSDPLDRAVVSLYDTVTTRGVSGTKFQRDTALQQVLNYHLLEMCKNIDCRLKVGPDDATFLFGTRDSVPMEHCSTLSQGVASTSNNV